MFFGADGLLDEDNPRRRPARTRTPRTQGGNNDGLVPALPPRLAALPRPATRSVRPVARAADKAETRDFQVFVDGKPAGQFHLIVTPAEGGKTIVNARASVRVRFAFYTYTYSYRGTEVWAGDRLERSQGTSIERKKKTTVTAVMQGEQTTITVNGQGRTDLPCAWTTTHWCLPPGARDNPTLAILDVDAGKRLQASLRRIESTPLNVAGQVRTCTRYRVSGGDQAEMWFDETGRLVQQLTVKDGHRTDLH